MSEGAAGAEFFVILEGTAKVTRHGQEVATLGPGDFFGDLALLDRAPRNATITAETPMELVVLGQREFAGLIDEVPGFAHKLLAGLARRLRAVRRTDRPVGQPLGRRRKRRLFGVDRQGRSTPHEH